MIKVNLAKTHSYASAGTQTAAHIDSLSPGDTKETVTKIVVILVFTVLLIGYEKYNLGQVEERSRAVQQQLTAVQQEIAQYGSATSIVEDLLKEKEKLNGQLKVIQTISQKRAFKLKTIMRVQEGLPDDLWLKELVVKDDVVEFKGYSRTPSSVQQVVRRLSESDFVDSALNQELKRVVLGKEALQEFRIEAKVKQ